MATVLRQVSTPVLRNPSEIKQIIADMTETMWHQVGIGLAAPQVGLPHRILVMDDGSGGAQALINPVIESHSGTVREEEGCRSLPGVFGVVERSKTITVRAMDADGKPVSLEATGLKAGSSSTSWIPSTASSHRRLPRNPRPHQEEDPEGRLPKEAGAPRLPL